jgi:hypothetical protein
LADFQSSAARKHLALPAKKTVSEEDIKMWFGALADFVDKLHFSYHRYRGGQLSIEGLRVIFEAIF